MSSSSPVWLPFAFPLMWLAMTGFLGQMSGWYDLMRRYPNRKEEPLLRLKGQSGRMGEVRMGGILHLSVCPSGLRIGIVKLFGIFCRDIFVPWEEIRIERKKKVFQKVAELRFGSPETGNLTIQAYLANRLAIAAAGRWPEEGPFLEENKKEVFLSLAKQWALMTLVFSTFFTVVPRIVAPHADGLPIPVTILFPGIFIGIAFLVVYFDRVRR